MSYSFVRAICALVIGLVLVLWPGAAINYLVITIGVLFLIPGLFSFIGYFAQKGRIEFEQRFPIESIGSVLLGLWLLIMPQFFANFLTYVLGFVLIMGGVQQLASLVSARKWIRVPLGFYIVPTLVLLAGLFTVFNPQEFQETIFIVIGITGIVYALTELFHWFMFTRKKPVDQTKYEMADEVEDIDALE